MGNTIDDTKVIHSDKTQSTRIEWVDWAKVIGIYLVVLGHGELVNESVKQLIYSFHMPLFFVLSGYLYKYKSLGMTVRRGWQSLMVPYMLINAILLVYGVLITLIKGGCISFDYLYSRVVPIIVGLGYNAADFMPVCTPLWFVMALFIIQLIFSLSAKRGWRMLMIVGSMVSSLCLDYYEIDTLVPIDSALMAMPFFVIGYEAKEYLKYKISVYWWIPVVLALCVINSYNGRVDIALCEYGRSLSLMYIGGLLGTILVCQVARFLRGGVSIYTSGLLLIIGFNLTAIHLTTKVWHVLLPAIEINSTIGATLAAIICILFYPCILFCKKYCKSLIGYR